MAANTLPDPALRLGSFLCDRRARLLPAKGGEHRRRTPGLRREEVATRAHVTSADGEAIALLMAKRGNSAS